MIKKYYVWKELTYDGLLKEPRPVGPHYNESTLNDGYSDYESEEDAYKGFEEFFKENGYLSYDALVLVTTYRYVEDE